MLYEVITVSVRRVWDTDIRYSGHHFGASTPETQYWLGTIHPRRLKAV